MQGIHQLHKRLGIRCPALRPFPSPRGPPQVLGRSRAAPPDATIHARKWRRRGHASSSPPSSSALRLLLHERSGVARSRLLRAHKDHAWDGHLFQVIGQEGKRGQEGHGPTRPEQRDLVAGVLASTGQRQGPHVLPRQHVQQGGLGLPRKDAGQLLNVPVEDVRGGGLGQQDHGAVPKHHPAVLAQRKQRQVDHPHKLPELGRRVREIEVVRADEKVGELGAFWWFDG